MKEKVKCKKCGLFIDSDCQTCPYCGYPQNNELGKEDKASKNIENLIKDDVDFSDSETKTNENFHENNVSKDDNKIHFFNFESRVMDIKLSKNIILFLVGYILLNLVAFIFSMIAQASNSWYFLASGKGTAAINFATYFFIFGVMFIVLNNDITKFFKEFKDKYTWIYGLAFGFLLMLASSAVTSLMQLFKETGVNNNEASIDATTSLFPFLSILIFGILGPICEEFTYRAGLFSIIKRYNRALAYVVTALFFGFIHFTFNLSTIVDELINLPSYIVAGLLLCYFYDYKGIGASTVAHITNNLFALIMQLLLSSLG